ncbi:partial two-component system, NarL family, sensor histidine kinase EvgS, partial [Methylococcales bacterium]
DFAPHDPLIGLLQTLQSQKIALQDERDLAEKLSEERADLLQANAELSRQFSLIWEELVNLKQIEAETFKIALIANNTGNAVVMTDALGRVEWVNDSFTQMTGYTLQEIIGKTPGSVLQGEKTDPAVVEYIRRQIQLGESFGADILNYSKSGREYWVQFEVQPICDEEDRITNWMAIERDITEQKQSELELLEAKRAAESASRAKSAFLATMSHEIRTPMNAVLGTLTLLLDSRLDQEQELWAQSAYIAAQSLLNIIEDILDFSKIEAGKLTLNRDNFNLNSLITEVIQMFRIRTEGKGIGLSYAIAPETPLIVRGDTLRLRQILINLIGNAVKFTENGEIKVNVFCLERSESKIKLRFHVIDSGIGIPEDAQAPLFNEFVQVDTGSSRRYGGTGLGLAICKRLVKLMGGDIGVNSQLGHGSEFWFSAELDNPADTNVDDSEDSGDSPAPTRSLNKSPRDKEGGAGTPSQQNRRRKISKILVAEDGEINRLVVTAILGKAGYQVDVARDGREAIEAARTADYDLILMDVQMPELDGYQATAIIRGLSGHKAQVPILAFTANALQEDRNACLAAGMNDFVAKPVEKDRLLATIANWLRKDSNAQSGFPALLMPAPELPILLDEGTLKSLADHTDEQTMKETVVIFFADTAQRLEKISLALSAKDYQTLGFETHSIKSAAMTLGAPRLAMTCRNIENACFHGNLQTAELHSKELKCVFEKTQMAFIEHDFLPRTPSAG